MNVGKVRRTQMEKFIQVWNAYRGLSLQKVKAIPKTTRQRGWCCQKF